MVVDRSAWDAGFHNGPEEIEGISSEDLREQFEESMAEDLGRRSPRGRTKKGARLEQTNAKIDITRAAIIGKLVGKRGLDPRYETQSHFIRYAIDELIKKTFQELDNDELSSIYAAAIAEAEALAMVGLLESQRAFCEEMEEGRESNQYDQEALNLLKKKVQNFLPSSATSTIRERLLDIDWEEDVPGKKGQRK